MLEVSISVHWLSYNLSLQCEENLFQKDEPYTFIECAMLSTHVYDFTTWIFKKELQST